MFVKGTHSARALKVEMYCIFRKNLGLEIGLSTVRAPMRTKTNLITVPASEKSTESNGFVGA